MSEELSYTTCIEPLKLIGTPIYFSDGTFSVIDHAGQIKHRVLRESLLGIHNTKDSQYYVFETSIQRCHSGLMTIDQFSDQTKFIKDFWAADMRYYSNFRLYCLLTSGELRFINHRRISFCLKTSIKRIVKVEQRFEGESLYDIVAIGFDDTINLIGGNFFDPDIITSFRCPELLEVDKVIAFRFRQIWITKRGGIFFVCAKNHTKSFAGRRLSGTHFCDKCIQLAKAGLSHTSWPSYCPEFYHDLSSMSLEVISELPMILDSSKSCSSNQESLGCESLDYQSIDVGTAVEIFTYCLESSVRDLFFLGKRKEPNFVQLYRNFDGSLLCSNNQYIDKFDEICGPIADFDYVREVEGQFVYLICRNERGVYIVNYYGQSTLISDRQDFSLLSPMHRLNNYQEMKRSLR